MNEFSGWVKKFTTNVVIVFLLKDLLHLQIFCCGFYASTRTYPVYLVAVYGKLLCQVLLKKFEWEAKFQSSLLGHQNLMEFYKTVIPFVLLHEWNNCFIKFH